VAKFCKIIFLLLFSSVSLTAQNNDIKFEHLSVDHGLSNNIVYRIIQDSRGFMWFATEDGLNKYDGYNFTVYRNDPDDSFSLSDNLIWTLQESHTGDKHVLWIGTKYGGLSRMDLETEKFTHFKNDPDDPQSLSNNWVVSICEDSFGDLWIGTNGGTNKFNRETEKFVRYQNDPKDPNSLSHNINSTICESLIDGTSILWIGTKAGLNKFDRKTGKFIRYQHDRYNFNSLSHNLIEYLYADSSGTLWITTNNGGLNKFNIHSEQFTRFEYDPNNKNGISSNMTGTILEDKIQGKKVLWVDSFNGLNKLDLETEQFTHYKHNPDNPNSLSDNRLWTTYKDKTGIIWIGTYGGGLNKFDPGRLNFTHLQQETGNLNSLSHNVITSITESEYYGPNVFWIGTRDRGFNKYDRNTGSFTHYLHDPDNENSLINDLVYTILESSYPERNELWIGTVNGLDKLDLKTMKFTHYQNEDGDPYSISNNIIKSIFEDNTGKLWIGTRNGGLNKFDRTSGKFHQKKYNIGETLAIFEDNTGTLWVGTYRGLARYNRDTDDFTYHEHDPGDSTSLSNRSVLSMYEDKSFRLWIGTRDGLNLFNRVTNRFIRYKVINGLPNNVINGILEDDFGNLWLSTNHGLSKFNPEQNTFRNYDLLDGLQSNQFMTGAFCLSNNGEMFFGGVKGINVFYPESIRDNLHIPDVYLTDFKIFNKKVDVKTEMLKDRNGKYYLPKHISNISEITLSNKESVFSLEFAVLDYHSPQKNQYAYKMEGVDPDWVYTDASRRFATYTQLDPGEYIFRVKGSNNDDVWNEEGTSLKIIITPPWWRTTWAYAIYVFFFALTLYALRTYDKKRQRLKHDLEIEHLHTEKLEEVDRLKSRFFANISHEFRTPLTLILGPVEQMLSGEFKGNMNEQLKMIIRSGKRLLLLINQLLDLSKLESGKLKLRARETELISLTNGLVQAFESLAMGKNITLHYSSEMDSQAVYLDVDKYEKIINNLLSNAFKFTRENGNIEISVCTGEAFSDKYNRSALNSGWNASPQQFPDSDFVEIQITNTGPGIPADKIDKIFDRFYQIDDSYTKDEEGTGIGLALTKELVELHHGTIDVECRGMEKQSPTPPLF